MSDKVMRTQRSALPVPGFPVPGVPWTGPSAEEGPGSVSAAGDERLDPGAPRRMLSVRVPVDLYERYAELLYEMQRGPRPPTMTELVCGLLVSGPRTTDEVRDVVRDWRRARDAEL